MTVEEFIAFMRPAFNELSRILNDVTERINLMSLGVKQATIPSYLSPGQTFLGKFFIQNILSYREIIDGDLFSQQNSVFAGLKPVLLHQATTGGVLR
jgi:hypothetical protein